MSVVSSNLRRSGWTGSGALGEGNRFTVEWEVETNSENDGPLTAALGGLSSSPDPVANAWDVYNVGNDYDPTVRLKRRSTRLHKYIKGGAIWIVTGTYEPPGRDEEADDLLPLFRPTKYRIEWINFQREAYEDFAGNKIVNSAGFSFNHDPIVVDDARPVLVASRNVAFLGEAISLGQLYHNAVNSDSFYGASPRHAKVESIQCSEKQEELGQEFYTMTTRVEFSRAPWDIVRVDAGMQYLDGSGNPKGADDDAGSKIGEPVLLSENGTKATEARFKTFRVYPERSFSALGI